MSMKILLAAGAAIALCASVAAKADSYERYGSDPNHYYSESDHDGFFDRNGNYHHFHDRNYGPPPPSGGYEHSGYYYNEADDPDCRRNNAGGTIAGAIGGGLIGGVASHGNGLAIAGGAILGGLVGNSLTRDVDCNDRRYAYDSYYRGLNGDVGVRVDWDNSSYGDRGYFVPVREYNRGGYRCRDFHTVTYHHGREVVRDGTACRRTDGQWYFD